MITPVDSKQWQIGLIGYGEVGRILAEDLRKQDIKVSAYDIKLGGEHEEPLRAHAEKFGVMLAASHAELAKQAEQIKATARMVERTRFAELTHDHTLKQQLTRSQGLGLSR